MSKSETVPLRAFADNCIRTLLDVRRGRGPRRRGAARPLDCLGCEKLGLTAILNTHAPCV